MAELFFDTVFLKHDTRDHPECAARLGGIMKGLRASPAWPAAGERHCPPAPLESVFRVHDPRYVNYVELLAERGGGMLDLDTRVSGASYKAALVAAGAAVAAVEGVMEGAFPSAFCPVRPPGHHAGRSRGMGFCLLNNVAVAAAHARAELGVGRVLIIDWDVHHGNGTQDIFDANPEVFYLSLHRHPHYPGTGDASRRGTGPAEGTKLNVPLPVGTGHGEYLDALAKALDSGLADFGAELVLISCGFDGAQGDPLGGFKLRPETFAEATSLVREYAATTAGEKIVSVLEGGYLVDSIGDCAAAHFERLP